MLPEKFGFIKKMTFIIKKKFIEFIYKEKSGADTKLKLFSEKRNQKFKNHNHVYLGTLVLVSHCYCRDNA